MSITTIGEARAAAEQTVSTLNTEARTLHTSLEAIRADAGKLRREQELILRDLKDFWARRFASDQEGTIKALRATSVTRAISDARNGINQARQVLATKESALKAAEAEMRAHAAATDVETKELLRLRDVQRGLLEDEVFQELFEVWQRGEFRVEHPRPSWPMCALIIPYLSWRSNARLHRSRVNNALDVARRTLLGLSSELKTDSQLVDFFLEYGKINGTVHQLNALTEAQAKRHRRVTELNEEVRQAQATLNYFIESESSVPAKAFDTFFQNEGPSLITAERVRTWPAQTHRQGFRYVVLAKQLEDLKKLSTPIEGEISRLTIYRDKVTKIQSKWRGKPSSKRTRKDMAPWLVDGRNRAIARSEKIRTRVVRVHHYYVNHVDDARDALIDALVEVAEQFVYAGGPEAMIDEAIAGANLVFDTAEAAGEAISAAGDAVQRTWDELLNESPIDRVFADEGEAGEDVPSHAEVEAFFPDVFDRDENDSDTDRDDADGSDDDSRDDDDDDRGHGADDGDGS